MSTLTPASLLAVAEATSDPRKIFEDVLENPRRHDPDGGFDDGGPETLCVPCGFVPCEGEATHDDAHVIAEFDADGKLVDRRA
jgi:hypothetical protein